MSTGDPQNHYGCTGTTVAAVADFKVGDIIDGTVTKLVNFGAFVRVRDGLEGLIHISASDQRVAHPGDVVHEGQSLKLKVDILDLEQMLDLKQRRDFVRRRDGVGQGPLERLRVIAAKPALL